MRKYVLTLLILIVCAFPVSAETTWHVAPGRSTIAFKVKHLIFLNVEGKFKKFEGKVVLQNGDYTNSQIEGKIQVNSIYTGNKDRDKDLLGENFFYADKFPEIVFKSKSTAKVDESTYKITGDLTIRSITKAFELTAKYGGQKELANGQTRVDFTATGSLNRFDYGLRWNELMETGKAIVGDTVEITLNIALLKQND